MIVQSTSLETHPIRPSHVDGRPAVELLTEGSSKQWRCRLCDGLLVHRFKKRVLDKYEVDYLECGSCEALQTEPPYWLGEAYDRGNLSTLDTGAAQRNLNNLAACFSLASLLKLENIIDFGGGDGLLCRLLRDQGFNCYLVDKYANPTYAAGFTRPDFTTPDLSLGFEVIEHLANPVSELDMFFALKPPFILLTTGIRTDELDDWWYLTPRSGQHVFFFTKKSLEFVARRYGYHLMIAAGYILFSRDTIPRLKASVIRRLWKPHSLRLIGSWIMTRPTPNVWKDHLNQAAAECKHQERQ